MYRFYPVLLMGKTDLFTQFYPTSFTQWLKLTVPTLGAVSMHEHRHWESRTLGLFSHCSCYIDRTSILVPGPGMNSILE